MKILRSTQTSCSLDCWALLLSSVFFVRPEEGPRISPGGLLGYESSQSRGAQALPEKENSSYLILQDASPPHRQAPKQNGRVKTPLQPKRPGPKGYVSQAKGAGLRSDRGRTQTVVPRRTQDTMVARLQVESSMGKLKKSDCLE